MGVTRVTGNQLQVNLLLGNTVKLSRKIVDVGIERYEIVGVVLEYEVAGLFFLRFE